MSSVPEEIQLEIFMKLPANSILVCRCVCKIWYNLLCNPKFVKNHLIHTNQTMKPRLILSQTDRWSSKNPIVYSIDYDSVLSSSLSLSVSTLLSLSMPTSDECACIGAVRMNYPFQHESIFSFRVLGSCNGLICVSMDRRIGMYLCIWNPITGEYKDISPPQFDDPIPGEAFYKIRYGFGHDCVIDDYKVVSIWGDVESPGNCKMQVYTLGSDSWNYINNAIPYYFPPSTTSCGMLFRGALHWIAVPEVIVSFNVSNDSLMEVPFPEVIPPEYGEELDTGVGVLGDCLSLCVAVVTEHVRFDVWVMQEYGVRESWAKHFTITDDQVSVRGSTFFKPIWSIENGEILINTGQGLVLYDQTNGRVRKVYFPATAMRRNLHGLAEKVGSYVESIVRLGSGTYVPKITGNPKMQKSS